MSDEITLGEGSATQLPPVVTYEQLVEALDRFDPWIAGQTLPSDAMRPSLTKVIAALSSATVWLPRPNGFEMASHARRPAKELLKLCVILRSHLPGSPVRLDLPTDVGGTWKTLRRQLELVYGNTPRAVGLDAQRTEFSIKWKEEKAAANGLPANYWEPMLADYRRAHPEDAEADKNTFKQSERRHITKGTKKGTRKKSQKT